MVACSKCKQDKPESEFHRDATTPHGRSYSCKECKCKACRDKYARNPELYSAKSNSWKKKNPEKYKIVHSKWLKANAELVRKTQKIRSARWYAKNCEKAKANKRIWAKKNKSRVRANIAAREARQLRATPIWACLSSIRNIYSEASTKTDQTGIAHHVDHTVPLRGRTVCGLHCEANLQVIPASINISKKHLYWPGM